MVLSSRSAQFFRLVLVGLTAFIGVYLAAHAQGNDQEVPRVTAAVMPLYPTLAVAARVQGIVKVRVTTNGKGVVSLETVSGPAMLVQYAKMNIQTWKFDQHKPTSFVTTFDYEFEDPPSCSYSNSNVSARLPLQVHVSIQRLQTCDPTSVSSTVRRQGKKD